VFNQIDKAQTLGSTHKELRLPIQLLLKLLWRRTPWFYSTAALSNTRLTIQQPRRVSYLI